MSERNEASEQAQEGLPPEAGTTGRYLVTLELTEAQQGLDVLQRIGVMPSIILEDAGEDVNAAQLNEPEATIYFKSLGIVVVGRRVSQEQLEQIRAAAEANTPVLSVEPERINEALSFP